MVPWKAQQTLAALKRGLTLLYGERLQRLYRFGSYARGEARPDSDGSGAA